MRCKAVLLMDHSASFISAKNKSLKVIVMFIAALMTFLVMTEGFSADAAAAKLSTPKMTAQINYGSEFTHPYNKQTNTIKVHWSMRISYAQKLIVAVAVPVASRCLGKTIEQVTGYFNTGFDLKTIGLIESRGQIGRIVQGVIDEAVAHVHDKEVLVTVFQYRIIRVVAFEVLFTERL